jgi:hypothetical protein
MTKQKSIPKLLAKAQTCFNKWIRERDKDKGCISCGAEITEAGHYRSQGHYGSLRFNEINCNGQCSRCNRWLHGNLIEYRKGLISRYGEQKIVLLESVKGFKKWSLIELEQIIKLYQQ